MELEKELQPGDYLFTKSTYHSISKSKVLRLTTTQIVLDEKGNTRLKRPFRNMCTAIGSRGYGSTYYYLPTPELEEEYQRKLNDQFIGTFGWKATSNEKTQLIVDFLKQLK